MPSPLAVLRAGIAYLRKNPTELIYVARNAAGLKIVLPLDALRWLSDNSKGGKRAPKDVVIGGKPPAITVAATVDLMGTPCAPARPSASRSCASGPTSCASRSASPT